LPTPEAAGIPRDRSEHQKVQVELPSWIKVDAHLCYLSRSSGRVMEVVVEMISHSKCEVEITFMEDSKIWKVLPFSVIASDANPLLGPWSSGSSNDSKSAFDLAQQSDPDKGEIMRRLQESTAEMEPAGRRPETRERSRSRSPKPTSALL